MLSENLKIKIHKTVIVPVVLKHQIEGVREQVLRIFGLTNEVTGGGGKLCNELHNLYSLSDMTRMLKSGRMRWAGHVVCDCAHAHTHTHI